MAATDQSTDLTDDAPARGPSDGDGAVRLPAGAREPLPLETTPTGG